MNNSEGSAARIIGEERRQLRLRVLYRSLRGNSGPGIDGGKLLSCWLSPAKYDRTDQWFLPQSNAPWEVEKNAARKVVWKERIKITVSPRLNPAQVPIDTTNRPSYFENLAR